MISINISEKQMKDLLECKELYSKISNWRHDIESTLSEAIHCLRLKLEER